MEPGRFSPLLLSSNNGIFDKFDKLRRGAIQFIRHDKNRALSIIFLAPLTKTRHGRYLRLRPAAELSP
jgi:hypothetical protein